MTGKLYDADGKEVKPPKKCRPGYYWIPMVSQYGILWLEQKDYKAREIDEESTEETS